MSFEVISAHGKTNVGKWRNYLAAMPYDLRDVHMTAGWGLAHERGGWQARLAAYTGDGFVTIKPFMVRPIAGSNFVDLLGIGYGGPVTSSVMPTPDEAGAFDYAFELWARKRHAVTEFYLMNPDFLAHQAIFHPDLRQSSPVRTVNILPLPLDLDRVSHGRKDALRRAAKATVHAIDVKAFWRVYNADMERKGAATRWRYSLEHFEMLARELGSACSILGAFRPGDDDDPGAVAIFLTGGAVTHYYLAASDGKRTPGLADRLIAHAATQKTAAFMILGGGLKDGDSLDQFKASWGGFRKPIYAQRRVINISAYMTLSNGVERSSYFPQYRASEAS